MWVFLVSNYNGGPEISLNKNNDIYTSFVSCSGRTINCYGYYNNKDNSIIHNSSKIGNLSIVDYPEDDESKLDFTEDVEMKNSFKGEMILLQEDKKK